MSVMLERVSTGVEGLPSTTRVQGRMQCAGESVGLAIGNSVARIHGFGQHLRVRAETVKQQRPLQVLAAFAGVAVVAGFAARVWRSRNA